MRKLVVCNIVSLDGFYSGPGGDVMAMPFDDGFSDYNAERLRAADTLLLGRKSYEGFRSYWPAIAEDVSQPAVERAEQSFRRPLEEALDVSGTLASRCSFELEAQRHWVAAVLFQQGVFHGLLLHEKFREASPPSVWTMARPGWLKR